MCLSIEKGERERSGLVLAYVFDCVCVCANNLKFRICVCMCVWCVRCVHVCEGPGTRG